MIFSARVEAVKSGVRVALLRFDAEEPPDIICSAGSDIPTSFSGRFLAADGLDLLSMELRPVVTIDGVETRCGLFRPATVSRKTGTEGDWWNVTAYDRCWQVQSKRTTALLHLASGTNYLTAVESLLTQAGISVVVKTPTTATLTTDREDWDIGTDYLTIVNQLLSEINYAALWFDADGTAQLRPAPTPSASTIRWSYDAAAIRGKICPNATSETDVFSAANHFIVVCSNADLAAPLVATATNDSPQSALSTVRRGMTISQLVKVDNIASQTELQAYANRLARRSRITDATYTVSTLPEPGHGVGDIVAVTHPALSGICTETGWTLRLSHDQLMTHTLQKEVYAT